MSTLIPLPALKAEGATLASILATNGLRLTTVCFLQPLVKLEPFGRNAFAICEPTDTTARKVANFIRYIMLALSSTASQITFGMCNDLK